MNSAPRCPASARRVGLALAMLAAAAPSFAAEHPEADETRMLIPSMSYDADAGGVLGGGRRSGATYDGLLHLRLRWIVPGDSDWRGTSAFVDVRNVHGGHLSQLAGDAQGVDNIEAPGGTDIHELWAQHNFLWSGVSVLAGLYDVNSEFDRLQAAGLFLNSSFGVTPEFAASGGSGASIYPHTAAALRLSAKPWHGTLLRAAVVDGASFARADGSHALIRHGDGLVGLVEWNLLRKPDAVGDEPTVPRIFGRFTPLPTYEDKIAVGAWRYTTKFAQTGPVEVPDDGLRHPSQGGYVIGEWRLLGRGADAKRRLSGFAQFGGASQATNRFDRYWGGGLVGSGWLFGRDSDQVGLSVASARQSPTYRERAAAAGVASSRAETSVELSWLTQPATWMILEPDLQRVNHPDADPRLRDAWVVQLRSELTF